MRGQRLKTSRAWTIKEMFRDFWASETAAEGRDLFARWYGWAIRSCLELIRRVARSFKAHLDNLLTYFTHRISNALTEGFNSKIQALKADARGFRRFENYRARILFFCGKLDLAPHLVSTPTHTNP